MKQRHTLSLLIAAAAAMPAIASAQSSVTVYGIVDATVRHQRNASASGDSLTSLADGAYTGSRWGLRGSEDLGNGLKAVFTLENGFDPSSGTMQQASGSANATAAAAAWAPPTAPGRWS